MRVAASGPTRGRALKKTVGVLVMARLEPKATSEAMVCFAESEVRQVLKVEGSRAAAVANWTSLSQTFSAEMTSWLSKI